MTLSLALALANATKQHVESSNARLTMENSSAMKKAISSPASGLLESGLKSIRNVSRISRIVSTSPVPPSPPSRRSRPASSLLGFSPSPSRRRVAINSRKEPDATEAGYCFAKLRRPSIAARRSSRSVAECNRPHSVSIVDVAVCRGGVFSIVIEGGLPVGSRLGYLMFRSKSGRTFQGIALDDCKLGLFVCEQMNEYVQHCQLLETLSLKETTGTPSSGFRRIRLA